jgi:hypothetical protein
MGWPIVSDMATMKKLAVTALATALVLLAVTTPAQAHHASAPRLLGGLGPANPFMARGGVGAMHSDSYSSDASPQPGPGTGPIQATLTTSGAICATTLLDRQGQVIAYCVDHTTRRPDLRLLDPRTLVPLATLALPPTGLLGGFYMYLDDHDRAVLSDGRDHLLRVAHTRDSTGAWQLRVVNDWDVSAQVSAHCGSAGCDYVESVTPDWSGRIWFSTARGVVGALNPATGSASSLTLPTGEQVANSLSAAPAGVAVVSDHALYLLRGGPDGTPQIRSRIGYDRGSGIKPGQLSWGSGTTPVFFGPGGDRYLTIADNADSQEHLLVYRVDPITGLGRQICRTPLFTAGASAVENAPIAVGRSVIVPNTYGYDYRPGSAPGPIPGGLIRIDVRRDESGCATRWTDSVPSAAVPKLSVRDGYIYTIQRTVTGTIASYDLVVIDSGSGAAVRTRPVGTGPQFEANQLAGVSTRDGTLYQGTVSGIVQIRP